MSLMVELLKKIDKWLLPRNLEERYSPYVWLIYLPMFFLPVLVFYESTWQLYATALATIGFLIIYFHCYWSNGIAIIWDILAVLVLGLACAFYTPSACTFFIYAAAMCCILPKRIYSYLALAFICVFLALITWLFEFTMYFAMPAIAFSIIVGLINIYQRALAKNKHELVLSKIEIQRLAKVAERERIARDLHDLIGHTFSVITLKADLAGRLLDNDLKQARSEIKQIETISREALSQVREVVSGYRSSDLLSELANAKHILASMNVEFNYQLIEIKESQLNCDMATNKELAIVFRELVTNIIKHANASKVEVKLNKYQQGVLLSVQDNGKGMPNDLSQDECAGHGLKGISERISKIKGWVKLNSAPAQSGTLSQIYVPLTDL